METHWLNNLTNEVEIAAELCCEALKFEKQKFLQTSRTLMGTEKLGRVEK